MACSVSFSIARWSAWAPGLDCPRAWLAWARTRVEGSPSAGASCDPANAAFVGEGSAKLHELPALLVRRASRSDRAGLRAALDCTQGLTSPVSTVFASRHG